ncbi:MinD/ParA family ATP-binding protein [Halomicrobium urmianum]|uniref:MinD/ParA family ATP-binding protein n=1 Tax=Halomicrobium urmianum TaxID=1586233 RepID=UPI001CD9ECD0|nr:AAA family ATPase [Halomicrobium urmianum]
MAGYVCTIAGGKGGVGKTTTAVNVGVALQEMGHDVVVVDADLGMANLGAMLGIEHGTSVHDVLASGAAVSDALTDAPGGLTIIPGEQSLDAFADADPAKLRKVIRTLRNAYDAVLIDTGAGLSHEVAVPLGLSDGVLLVTTPDDVAVGDTVKTAQLADRIDDGGEVIGAVLNRVTRHTDVPAIADELGHHLLAVVPDDLEATSREPLVLNAPDSRAARAFQGLTAHLDEIFFTGADPGDLETVVEEEWFVEDDEADAAEAEGSADTGDDDESGGVFGLFN